MTDQPPHPSSGCAICLDYLSDRLGVLRLEFLFKAAEIGSTVQEVLEDYMGRVHARHLAGGRIDVPSPITVAAAPMGEPHIVLPISTRPHRPCRDCRLTGRTHRSRRARAGAHTFGAVQ